MSLLARPQFRARCSTLIIQRGLKKKNKGRIPVTLLADVPHVGSAGTVAQVSRAHMRHELFPKRLAEYVVAYKGPLDRSKREAEAEARGASAASARLDALERAHALALRNQDTI
ncbi:hypothetical protein IWQ56_006612, partial [Coemansia nantahalensis]